MELRLSDDEIREALAEALSKKIDHAITDIDPDECWFEVKAGEIDGDEVNDIHDVKFCYNNNEVKE